MPKASAPNRNKMIHCDVCGEDYAATYRRCPFCNGRPPEEDDGRRGGRRVATNTRGGGYSSGPTPAKVLTTVISLALIVAAVCIVVSIVKPMIDRGSTTTPPSATPVVSATPAPTDDPAAEPSVTPPADQTATGFTLSQSDFTLSHYGETHTISASFSPADSVGYLVWTSSAPNVVSVDENGTVKGIGKSNGVASATITATLKGTDIAQSCIVRVRFDAPAGAAEPSASPSGSGASSAALSLNQTDFTMPKGSTVQMRVSGTSSTPAWSTTDSAVATVDANGLITMAGKGTTTLVCKVDGQELTCIVRCSG
ncbi:Ig-like domain-containing protein [Pseudoflavonifractor sp. MSJ-37]|nr:Ig-like domain-containing protein [Pseudoflavonifractor sp. MSJ-37]